MWVRDKNRREHQKEDWLNRIRKEIRIMRNNLHISIIQMFDELKGLIVRKKHIVKVMDF